jgi:hypothetical protein
VMEKRKEKLSYGGNAREIIGTCHGSGRDGI